MSPDFNHIVRLINDAGAAAWATTAAGSVDTDAHRQFISWIDSGHAAGMDYLSRNPHLRASTDSILPDARSIIVCAFPYASPQQPPRLPIAAYALSADYHHVLKQVLNPVITYLEECGHKARTCVDSAPLAERYWAVRSGLGHTGLNCQLSVPGCGSRIFLASILTTAQLPSAVFLPDINNASYSSRCDQCGRCLKACPAKALNGDGTLDARRCLNYLTIEHKGPFPDNTDLHGHLFGCDVCTQVCPLNNPRNINCILITQLSPDPAVMALDADTLTSISSSAFNRRFRHSPISRPGLKGLLRNLHAIRNIKNITD